MSNKIKIEPIHLTSTTEILTKLRKKIQLSKKYSSLAPQTVSRIVQASARRFPEKQVEDEAKKKLHQIWGAYYTSRPNFKKLETKISEELSQGKDLKEIFLPLLKIHSSTKERIPILNEFYSKIFAATGNPVSILDHAAGLNALTIPWMQLPATTKYTAHDIDKEEVLFLNSVFKIINKTPPLPQVNAKVKDLFEETDEYYEIHFLYKILPLLEQQRKDSSAEILKSLKGKYLVVTFPTGSLSGKQKGMIKTYTRRCEDIIASQKWDFQRIAFNTELVYVINKLQKI